MLIMISNMAWLATKHASICSWAKRNKIKNTNNAAASSKIERDGDYNKERMNYRDFKITADRPDVSELVKWNCA